MEGGGRMGGKALPRPAHAKLLPGGEPCCNDKSRRIVCCQRNEPNYDKLLLKVFKMSLFLSSPTIPTPRHAHSTHLPVVVNIRQFCVCVSVCVLWPLDGAAVNSLRCAAHQRHMTIKRSFSTRSFEYLSE